MMQDIDISQYPTLLSNKVDTINTLFSDFDLPELQVFASETQNFRLRAEFRLWHEGEKCFFAMFEPGKKTDPYEVKELPIASVLIYELMPRLIEALNASELLKRRLFQVEFLTTLSGEVLVTLIYHKALGDDWREAGEQLSADLGIQLIGRSRKQKIVLQNDWVEECLTINNKQFKYKQIEGGFTQPNGKMNQKMLEWAIDASQGLEGDLLELYCGNGNFSIALADHFDHVVATEISKTSINAALYNKEVNGLDNIEFARMAAEEFTQAIQGEREFRRLSHINLNDYNFTTVLVDPPRAGLDEASVKMIQVYDNIIYVSCNPETLKENLAILCETHDIESYALFDQFPYTHHIESGVLLRRKK
jgi:tRNA (uracil-5-)-methyltransferase